MEKRIETSEDEKQVVPEIRIRCPSCHCDFSVDAMQRIYRAYVTLTRSGRNHNYKAVCSSCGKITSVRVPPKSDYLCRFCTHKHKMLNELNSLKNAKVK